MDTTELSLYIKSEGFRLPKDHEAFRDKSDRGDLCVFCAQPHSHMPVYQYLGPPDAGTGVITGAHCCDDCYYSVHRMEQTFVGFSPRLTLISDESWTSEKRRYEYASNAHFDATVHFCYQHAVEEGLAPLKDKCYFCQLDKPPSENDHFIEVPVSTSERMTGGFVRMCNKCKYLMEQSKEVFAIEQRAALRAPSDVCGRCGHHYLVTNDEYQTRAYMSTLGKHHCPKCTYVRCTVNAGDALITRKNNLTRRFQVINCRYCSQPFSFDKTFAFDLACEYLINGKPTCRKCKEHGNPPIYALRHGDFFIRVFTSKTEQQYKITKVNVASEKETVYLIDKENMQDFIDKLIRDERAT